ncbi:MAG: LysR family transcriptional regulator [Sphingomonas sp.]
MADLNYHHLKLFRAIAREGGLTRAAEKLHLSQSALSTQLQKLEAALGHPLFTRIGKRLELTEAGRIALDYADTVFGAGDELLRTLEGQPQRERQTLRVGSLTTLSRNFQLEFLRPLIGRSDVELNIRSGTLRELLAALTAHTLDIVLTNTAVRRDAALDLHTHLIETQPVSLVSRSDHDATAALYPAALATTPVVVPSLDSDIRVAFDRALALAGITPVILAEIDDMAMLRLFARESGALTLVPPIVVQDELRNGVLVERHRFVDVAESFYAIVQDRRFPNPLIAGLLDRHLG